MEFLEMYWEEIKEVITSFINLIKAIFDKLQNGADDDTATDDATN